VNVYLRTAAREDILRQYSYYLIEKNAALAADRFLEAMQSAIEMLCRNPEAGAPRLLLNPILAGLRSWPVHGFPAMRIYYLYAGKELRIVRVLHGKRDIISLLEEETANEDD
jgi:plasmid stabilization system protein ParE